MSAGIAIRTATIALAAVGGPAYIVAAGVAIALGVGAKAYCDHKAEQKRIQQQRVQNCYLKRFQ